MNMYEQSCLFILSNVCNVKKNDIKLLNILERLSVISTLFITLLLLHKNITTFSMCTNVNTTPVLWTKNKYTKGQ